jgi:PmbA protein
MTTDPRSLVEICQVAVAHACAAGAQVAEAVLVTERELTTKVRLGAPELVQQASSRALGLRVIQDQRTAVGHTADLSPAGLEAFGARIAGLARLAEPDPHAGPPDPADLARTWPDLDLWDAAAAAVTAPEALDLALRAEAAARAADPRITNSEGATFGASDSLKVMVTSGGFVGHVAGTYASLAVEPVADDADGKKRTATHWDGRRRLAALASPEAVGQEAARRTVAQLGARKLATADLPVIFTPESGAQILRTLFGLVSGEAAYRRSTYLIDREGQAVASALVTVVDDPLLPGAPGSRPFDGDGLPSRRNVVVDAGQFTGFLCDTYSARRLGRTSTHSAGRGVGGVPGVSSSNFHLVPGTMTADELLAGTDRALLVTHLMGFGFNPVTGDFSKGAEGFYVEKGQRLYPVSEVTVSASFQDLLTGIDAIASDLDTRGGTACPTFRVRRMTVAGE